MPQASNSDVCLTGLQRPWVLLSGWDVTSCLSSYCLDIPPMTGSEQNYGRGMLAWPALPVCVISEHMRVDGPLVAATLPVTGDNQYIRVV